MGDLGNIRINSPRALPQAGIPALMLLRYRRGMPGEVSVVDLSKCYGSVAAVRNLSLQISGGHIFGLLGANGAGKTTTLECILGLRTPDSGTVTIDGMNAITEPEKARQIIGAQLQATALQDKLTPREAIAFFGAFYKSRIKPAELLKRFSLNEKANAPFETLSAGQKQRLALALAFVNDPKVIFLDEPTAGLDPQARRDLHQDILQLRADGKTVVLSTHFIEEAHRLCDRIAIINHGSIVAEGTPDELVTQASSPHRLVFTTLPTLSAQQIAALPTLESSKCIADTWELSASNITDLVVALMKQIEAVGATLIDLRLHRPSLEDAFLKLIAANQQSLHDSET